MLFQNRKLKIIALCALLLLGILIPFFADAYVLTVLSLALVYAVIATGYNVLMGYTGLFSFGQMAFTGFGAYTCILLMNRFNMPFFVAVICVVLLTIAVAIITAYPALGLRGYFFGISTLAVGETIVLLLTNLEKLTGGMQGIVLTKSPALFGYVFASAKQQYYLAFVFYILATVIVWYLIYRTKMGKNWVAVRGDEDFASTLGINTKMAKLTGYVAGCALAGLGGCIYLVIMLCLMPDSFNSVRTTEIIMMVLLGGKGTIAGPLVGSVLLTWLPQVLQMSPQVRLIVYGFILILVILIVPQGIIGSIKEYLGGERFAKHK